MEFRLQRWASRSMQVEKRLAELGINLPAAEPPIANYVTAVQAGGLLFFSGRGPAQDDSTLLTGMVGRDVTVEEAYQHARVTGLQLISAMKAELRELDRVGRIVKVLGMVNAVPGFNGCSDLLVEAFGERDRHARSAVGMSSCYRRSGQLARQPRMARQCGKSVEGSSRSRSGP